MRPSRQEKDTHLFTQVLLSILLGFIYIFHIYIFFHMNLSILTKSIPNILSVVVSIVAFVNEFFISTILVIVAI